MGKIKDGREISNYKFHTYLHAIKTKHYIQCVPIVGMVGCNIGSY